MNRAITSTGQKVFYGWVMVGVTFVAQFLTMGTGFYVFGVLLKPLTDALDADRFLVSLALSTQTVLIALLGPVIGVFISKYSIRLLMCSGTLLMSLGFFILSQAQELWHLYLSFGVIVSAGMAMSGPLPNNALLANWFVKRRGTAMGISQFGLTISGTILVPIATWLVLEFGWRATVMLMSLAVPSIMIPIILFMVIKTPEEKGLLPDGDSAADSNPEPNIDQEVWTMGRAIREKRIWLLTLVVGPAFMGIGAIVLSIHSHATDLGLAAMEASSVVAAMTLTGAIAKPLFGTVADYYDKRLVMGMSLILQFTGVACIIFLEGYSGLILAGAIFGLGYGGVMPLWGILLGAMFGRHAFSRIMGFMMPLTLPFTLVGLPFTTLVFERTGSYVPAYATLLGAFVLAAISLLFLRLPPSESVHAGST